MGWEGPTVSQNVAGHGLGHSVAPCIRRHPTHLRILILCIFVSGPQVPQQGRFWEGV